jgi:hypothetical protein
MTEAWASDGNIRTRVIIFGTVEWDSLRQSRSFITVASLGEHR